MHMHALPVAPHATKSKALLHRHFWRPSLPFTWWICMYVSGATTHQCPVKGAKWYEATTGWLPAGGQKLPAVGTCQPSQWTTDHIAVSWERGIFFNKQHSTSAFILI